MGLKCPFLSAPVANVSGSGTGGDMIISSTIVMHYYDCLEIDCKIWDHINSRCGAMTSDIHVHVHNEHHHVKTHRGSESTVVITDAPNHFVNTLPTINPDMYEDAPDPESAQGAPNAATLIDEYLNKKDRDKNGKMFGYDFTITDPPPMLSGLMNTPSWKNPACRITMAQYKTWIDTMIDPC